MIKRTLARIEADIKRSEYSCYVKAQHLGRARRKLLALRKERDQFLEDYNKHYFP